MGWLAHLFAKRYRTLLYEVTPRCNLDCLYCYNVWKGEAPYPAGELSTQQARHLLRDVIAQTRCENVTLTGGEPLLRDDLVELIQFTREQGSAVSLISNGALLNEERSRACVEAGVGMVELPILSTDRETHRGLTRGGSLDAVLEAVAHVTAAGAEVAAVFVATKRNIAHFREVAELCVGMRIAGILLNRFNVGGEGRHHIDDLTPLPEELEAVLNVAEEVGRQYGIPIASSVPIPPCVLDTSRYRHVTFGACPLGTPQAYLTIDPLGNLRPCNHSPTIWGSLFEQRFDRLAHGQAAQAYIQAVPEDCAGCTSLADCRGGCRAAAEACHGSPTDHDPFVTRCGTGTPTGG